MEPQHNYATRIRQNIAIKPAARRRNSPDSPSSKHQQVVHPNNYPPFPPQHVELHPDDATNKVFLAVARAFVSVQNRAMTIKDIAEQASRYGLVCQNLSAAAQAVTTYLRAHKARCDQQQDHPLLLSHTLSGTPADDDLVPALYSRSGGDSHPLPNRLTNFRKGTAVWYLSRATGVPCPFTKAGIRLCDYVNLDPQDPTQEIPAKRERNRQDRETVCGQKRKRPLRGCVARASGSDNERPPKVKLTLRLKPLLTKQPIEGSTSTRPIDVSMEESDSYDSGDESMSVDSSDDESQTAQIDKDEEEPWSLPPYPRRSISIPCYTPSVETYFPCYPPSPSQYKDPFRRSPSIPSSVATPPPDSEDEADDFHVTMTRIKDYPEQFSQEDDTDLGWDADLDSEGDGETMWESPGPRSPSAPLILPTEVAVKEEPRDVQGMLDAWEDFDSTIADARVAEVLAKALDGGAEVKVEATDPWDWDAGNGVPEWASEDTARIKQEDFGVDSFLIPTSSPLSPDSSLSSHFSAFSSDTSSPHQASDDTPELDDERNYPTIRPRAKTVPVPSPFFQSPTPASLSLSPLLTGHSSSKSTSREPSVPSTALVTLLQSMSVGASGSNSSSSPASTSSVNIPPPAACVSPLQTRCVPSAMGPPVEKVVVHTCQPCHPAISATQIEDISVYQMMLGAFQLLRRIDTDFVNLSPIVAYSGAAPVSSSVNSNAAASSSAGTTTSGLTHPNLIANATVITKGSPEVCGTWVPLSVAQAYIREHLSGEGARALEVFLSDTLVECFPSALQDFHRTNRGARGLNQFGRHFASTLVAGGLQIGGGGSGVGVESTGMAVVQQQGAGGPAVMMPGMNTLVVPTPSFVLGLGHADDKDMPLSATEQELFHELCVIPPDWEKEGGSVSPGGSGSVADDEKEIDQEEMMVMDEAPSTTMPKASEYERSSPLPPTPTTAVPIPIPGSSKSSRTSSSSISSISSLSSCGSSSTSLSFAGDATKMDGQESTAPTAAQTSATDRPLRRSKRVADALAAHAHQTPQPARTRSRKGSSRTSLS